MLDETERKKFRSLAATLNYMSLDISDMQYAAKEISTKIVNPTQGSLERLKKAGTHPQGLEKCDTVDAGMGTRRCDRGCARGFGLGKKGSKGSRREEA